MSDLPLPPPKGDNTPCTPASGGQERRGKKRKDRPEVMGIE